MKKIFKKNQIIITALALMIVVAGYLNFTGQEISTSGLVSSDKKTEKKQKEAKKTKEEKEIEKAMETDISDAEIGEDAYEVSDAGEVVASEENPGEAVMVSGNISSDYFTSAKLSREQSRAKNKETLMEIVNNKEVASADKKAAVKEVAQITKAAEMENAAELMLEAKGFSEAVVSISENSADVVVNVTDLSEKEIAQIEDIVKRKTDVSAENIVITPVSVKK